MLCLLDKVCRAASFEVLHLKRYARRYAQAGNRGRDKGIALSLGDSNVKFLGQLCSNLRSGEFSLGVILQHGEDNSAVCRAYVCHHIKSRSQRGKLHLGTCRHDLLDVTHSAHRGLQRRGLGSTNKDHQIALILIRQESRREHFPANKRKAQRNHNKYRRTRGVPNYRCSEIIISLHLPIKPTIEQSKESSFALLMLSQKNSTQSRRERQGIECREHNGRSNGYRELAKQ